jgi:hypothetical protein
MSGAGGIRSIDAQNGGDRRGAQIPAPRGAANLYCYVGNGLCFKFQADTVDQALVIGNDLVSYMRSFLPPLP